MDSLFRVKFNWGFFLLLAFLARILFIDMSWYSYAALLVTVWQFMLLFNSINHVIPVRYLLGCFMCIQFLVGSTLAYNGLDQYQYFFYKMQVPEEEYFSYVLPAVLVFILGLHLKAGRLKGERVNIPQIQRFYKKDPFIAYLFIIIGFGASLVARFFPGELAFVFYLLGSFKFVGLFIMVLGSEQLKLWPMVIVIGSIVGSSLGSGMFHDLLTWLVFIVAVFAIKYKFSFNLKLSGLIGFVMMVVVIQVMKGDYRAALGQEREGNFETFSDVYEERGDAGMFSFQNLAPHNVRINQGFIITYILNYVPARAPFENGSQMLKLLEAGILPRLFAPDKLRAGDRRIFQKYTGILLGPGTSMGLSSVGDAYINFGRLGGIVFMFALGLFYSWILGKAQQYSKLFPVIILFTTMVFYYPIRPDCEFQTILGHLFKSIILISGILFAWKYKFMFPEYRLRKKTAAMPDLNQQETANL